jgi:nucleoside-diphosphate-sugar epimerase
LSLFVAGRRLSTSHKFLSAFLHARGIISINYNISDVRDIAHATILSIEKPNIVGRYCVCNDAIPLSEILQMIHENFLDIVVPTRKVKSFPCLCVCFV